MTQILCQKRGTRHIFSMKCWLTTLEPVVRQNLVFGNSVELFNLWPQTPSMRKMLELVYSCLQAMLKERRDLYLENLALRQQLAVLKQSQARLKIKQRDRLFWIWLSRTWSGWREALLIVKPTTVIGWHRRGFRLYWTRLSHRQVGGRPAVSRQVRALIRQMATANLLWGAPRMDCSTT
jgi:hypothetical protein